MLCEWAIFFSNFFQTFVNTLRASGAPVAPQAPVHPIPSREKGKLTIARAAGAGCPTGKLNSGEAVFASGNQGEAGEVGRGHRPGRRS